MSATSRAVQLSIKHQMNLLLKNYIRQYHISYEYLALKTKIDIGTLKKIDTQERLTFYYLYKILDELGLWFEIKLKKSKKIYE